MLLVDCINCGACEPECPVTSIFQAGVDENDPPNNGELFWINPETCIECVGWHDEPQCVAVCPVDAVVPIPNESTFTKLNKSQ